MGLMRIYLDNNATTPIDPAVLRVLETSLRDVYGNASSIHQEGQAARRAIEEAREAVAALIGATAREIVFTSGGTESNNAAISGAVPLSGRHHIVTTAIEHPSVTEALAELERQGHAVTPILPARSGVVPAEEVIAAIHPETKLVTVMMASNETGVLQPVAEIGRACRERGVHFHCDAVQAAGRVDIDVQVIGCDTLALSAHKLHAPKGIGALYVRRGVTLRPHLVGGAQERRRRAGTENVPLAVAFGTAARLATETRFRDEVRALRDRFESRLQAAFGEAVSINGHEAERVPNTSNVSFRDTDGEGLVIALDLSGVAVSTGSACASGRIEPSGVLLAMGLTPAEAKSTVRFSLSRFTIAEELEMVAELLTELVPRCASPGKR